MNDIKILGVTPVEGAPIKKVAIRFSSARPGFELAVNLRLDDGRTLQSTVGADRKKDVLERLRRDNEAAAAGTYFATFDGDGSFWGTKQRYGALAGGLSAALGGGAS